MTTGSSCDGGTCYHGCSHVEAAHAEEVRRLRDLAAFGASLLAEWWEGDCSDVDGVAIQDEAEKYGLWHHVERHADGVECEWCCGEEPCGELTEAGSAALGERAASSRAGVPATDAVVESTATEILRKIVKAHDARVTEKGYLVMSPPTGNSWMGDAVDFLYAIDARSRG